MGNSTYLLYCTTIYYYVHFKVPARRARRNVSFYIPTSSTRNQDNEPLLPCTLAANQDP